MEKRQIYFDHAATTPVDRSVLEKMIPYFTDTFGNANSQHAFGREAMKAVDEARDGIAKIINAKPSELYFTSERRATTGLFAVWRTLIKTRANT